MTDKTSANQIKSDILENKTSLGIELGSTRIKAVLIGPDHTPIASGSHDWENQLVDGIWTYSLDMVWTGIQDCYAKLKQNVLDQYGVILRSVGSIGISAMMHGYMVFDSEGSLLVPFRTWRNTITARSSEILTELFNYPIPHRWSISHLYQAILNNEAHVPEIARMTTLAGYLHWQFTGENYMGVGEASGMFPIDLAAKDFNQQMLTDFDELIKDQNYSWKIRDILPKVLVAGQPAGQLTAEGAGKLDPASDLTAGIPFCPPEGDAGTGMTATNSVTPRTGNVSAGTSIFLMAVLEHDLKSVHPEIDLVTTPAGDLVAMVHCNNCTGDIDAWAKLFMEAVTSLDLPVSKPALYDMLYFKALEADASCGNLLSYNYISGESITRIDDGRPLLVRTPDSEFNLANLMRTNLYSALGTLKIGYDILDKQEGVSLDKVYGHGGFFKTERVGQQMMAAALEAPVTVMSTAGEGGPWGMAILAAFMKNRENETLPQYLADKVFSSSSGTTIEPVPSDIESFRSFMTRYRTGLDLVSKAAELT